MTDEQVLLTGGSGFVGAHSIVQLLNAGYRVRATVRSMEREAGVRAMLATAGANTLDKLSFVTADLTKDDHWHEAAAGCAYVMHVASPFPAGAPKHEDDLIVPAREGTLRVLRAARAAGVRRVVITSSFAAIVYGHNRVDVPFDERFWTNPDGPGVQAYAKSKTLAERAAWDYVGEQGGAMELATVNPVGIFGPVLGPDFSTSIQMVQRLLDGSIPGCPKLSFGVVDVRDVADLQLRAMRDPKAKNERFLAVAGNFMTMQEMALTLKSRLGAAGRKVPTRTLPNWLLRLIALFDPAVALITPELSRHKNATNEKARTLLGWSPRTREDALVATAESLLQFGLVKGEGAAQAKAA